MPCFVDKMGIGGHRIDLAADCLKLLVLFCQILQLGRANEGKVRRIEEEYTPLAQDVFLTYKLEFVFVIGIGAKIRNFFIDHRHAYFPHNSC